MAGDREIDSTPITLTTATMLSNQSRRAVGLGFAFLFCNHLRVIDAVVSEERNPSETAEAPTVVGNTAAAAASARFDPGRPRIDAKVGLMTRGVPLPSPENGGLGGRRIVGFDFAPIMPPYDSAMDDLFLPVVAVVPRPPEKRAGKVPEPPPPKKDSAALPDDAILGEDEGVPEAAEEEEEEIASGEGAKAAPGADNGTMTAESAGRDSIEVDPLEGEVVSRDSDRDETDDGTQGIDLPLEDSSEGDDDEEKCLRDEIEHHPEEEGADKAEGGAATRDDEDGGIQDGESDAEVEDTIGIESYETDLSAVAPDTSEPAVSSEGVMSDEEVADEEVADEVEGAHSGVDETEEHDSASEDYSQTARETTDSEGVEIDSSPVDSDAPSASDTKGPEEAEDLGLVPEADDAAAPDTTAPVDEIENEGLPSENSALTASDTEKPSSSTEEAPDTATPADEIENGGLVSEPPAPTASDTETPSSTAEDAIPEEGKGIRLDKEAEDGIKDEGLDVAESNEIHADDDDEALEGSQIDDKESDEPLIRERAQRLDDAVEYAAHNGIYDGEIVHGPAALPSRDGDIEDKEPDTSSSNDAAGEEVSGTAHLNQTASVAEHEKVSEPAEASLSYEYTASEADAGDSEDSFATEQSQEGSAATQILSDTNEVETPTEQYGEAIDASIPRESPVIGPDTGATDEIPMVEVEPEEPLEVDLEEEREVREGDDASTTDSEQRQQQIPPAGLAPSSSRVNAEFIDGLDDLHKFIEEVDPPDELDVGAGGTSMQEVLMGKSIQILNKRISRGVGYVRRASAKLGGRLKERVGNLREKAGNSGLAQRLKEGMESSGLVGFGDRVKERLDRSGDGKGMIVKQKERLARFGKTARRSIDHKVDQCRDLLGHDLIDNVTGKCRDLIGRVKDVIGMDDESEDDEEYMKYDALRERMESRGYASQPSDGGDVDDEMLGGDATSLKDRLAAIREQGKKNAESAMQQATGSGSDTVVSDEPNDDEASVQNTVA